jgi:hypothetical protein
MTPLRRDRRRSYRGGTLEGHSETMETGTSKRKAVATSTVVLIALLAIFSLLSVLALHETVTIGRRFTQPADPAALLIVTLVILACLLSRSRRARRMLLFALFILAAVEIAFQALALSGLLPRLSTCSHVPFGRVYWTKEGHANAVMNRYGWYYPDVSTRPRSRRVVLIGDSMIQAVQIDRNQNAGVVLEELVRERSPVATEVLAFGLSGTGPAHYLEMLDYAVRRFDPDEIILCIFIGNDFVNVYRNPSSPVDPRDRQIYYYVGDGGALTLHEGSRAARNALDSELAYNHRSLFVNAFRIARSHYLSRSVLVQLARGVAGRYRDSIAGGPEGPEGEMHRLGLDTFIFKKKPDEEGLGAVDVVTALLERCRDAAAERGIVLRIVTIPVFPSFFFDRFDIDGWNLETDEFDFSLPERTLVDFAVGEHVPILPLGSYMRGIGMDAASVKRLFLDDGRGHFSPAGHRFLAEALCRAFYSYEPGYAAVTPGSAPRDAARPLSVSGAP